MPGPVHAVPARRARDPTPSGCRPRSQLCRAASEVAASSSRPPTNPGTAAVRASGAESSSSRAPGLRPTVRNGARLPWPREPDERSRNRGVGCRVHSCQARPDSPRRGPGGMASGGVLPLGSNARGGVREVVVGADVEPDRPACRTDLSQVSIRGRIEFSPIHPQAWDGVSAALAIDERASGHVSSSTHHGRKDKIRARAMSRNPKASNKREGCRNRPTMRLTCPARQP